MFLFLIKLLYLICSPITTLYVVIRGVKVSGLIYTSGFPILKKTKSSIIEIGQNVRMLNLSWMNSIGLNHRCTITTANGASLRIGNNLGMSGCSIWCFKSIYIGNNVRIGANSVIMDGDAHQNDPRAGENKPIKIEDNVWIGANVFVLKGVTIGRNTVIGAGSVVTHSLPENVIAAGNPCKIIRTIK